MSARRNKFNAKPQVVDGVRFASKAEAKRDAELQLLAKCGTIQMLQRQPRFPLKVYGELICTYVGDWQYHEHGRVVIEDCKGVLTPAFKIKWKLAQTLFPEFEWRLS